MYVMYVCDYADFVFFCFFLVFRRFLWNSVGCGIKLKWKLMKFNKISVQNLNFKYKYKCYTLNEIFSFDLNKVCYNY